MGTPDQLRYPVEPPSTWDEPSLNGLLLWAADLGASDIAVNPNQPISIELHGTWRRVTERFVMTHEILNIIETMMPAGAPSATVKGGKYINFAHEVVREGKQGNQRFRCNATACAARGELGVSLVMRALPTMPPKLAELGIEPDLVEGLFPGLGLVLVVGEMGSGKSTTLAAVMREIRETQSRFVCTYEDPIEFNLRNIPSEAPLTQTQIPDHLANWADVGPNIKRRAADVALIGEAREQATLREMLNLAESSCAVYATVHAASCSLAIPRVVSEMPVPEQPAMRSKMASSLCAIVHQRLLPRADTDGRVAIREFLVLDERTRMDLIGTPLDEMVVKVDELISERGQTLDSSARAAYDAGKISDIQYQAIARETEQRQEAFN